MSVFAGVCVCVYFFQGRSEQLFACLSESVWVVLPSVVFYYSFMRAAEVGGGLTKNAQRDSMSPRDQHRAGSDPKVVEQVFPLQYFCLSQHNQYRAIWQQQMLAVTPACQKCNNVSPRK